MVIRAEGEVLDIETGAVTIEDQEAFVATHLGGGPGDEVEWGIGLGFVLRDMDVAREDAVGSSRGETFGDGFTVVQAQ